MKFKLFSLRRIAHFPSELFWRGALCDNKNCHVPESITNPCESSIQNDEYMAYLRRVVGSIVTLLRYRNVQAY
jgi:hypothetical protein